MEYGLFVRNSRSLCFQEEEEEEEEDTWGHLTFF
jgi:hypothetical protein